MTDPVGVSQDPRPLMLVGDEPDTVAELMALADDYAWWALFLNSPQEAKEYRSALYRALSAALEAPQP